MATTDAGRGELGEHEIMIQRALIGSALLAVVAIAAHSASAEAGRLFKRSVGDNGLQRGYVVAHSRFGNGSISGPVRMTDVGPQVRLPGGTWTHCRRSCSETLRVETVDIWEGRSDGSSGLSQECGIFGCLDIKFGW